ncbi:hypothetical protein DPPLL_11010 [Desulfofustis limnaeus]|jgi:hypothetical protein|uniref:Uncharacterized protein n=1 Tax=Desulfofustis limnaeus TaxID=2740163 RepID=A0ABM7W717_9BACT|nr:hypothetical protein DPPLL_11010 [Desulfofustis limnaeus]
MAGGQGVAGIRKGTELFLLHVYKYTKIINIFRRFRFEFGDCFDMQLIFIVKIKKTASTAEKTIV